MFGSRATPASNSITPSTDDSFTVHFRDLNGFIAHGPSFDGTSPESLYKQCSYWYLEIGTVLHLHSRDQNKDTNERVVIVYQTAGPEGFLIGYSFCKHEPWPPSERHWHVRHYDSETAGPGSSKDANQTLDVHLRNDWKLEPGITVNLTLPFPINSNSSTKVRVLGTADKDSSRALREAIIGYQQTSGTGDDIAKSQQPSWSSAMPHVSEPEAREPLSSESPKPAVTRPRRREDKTTHQPSSSRKRSETINGWTRPHTKKKASHTWKKDRG